MTERASVARALALHQRGQFQEALAEIDASLAADPRAAGNYNARGLILAALGDFTGAVAAYDHALERLPADADALTNRGSALLRLGRRDAAMKDLQAAADLQPTYATAHFNLARGFAAHNRLDAAIASYDRALAIDPRDAKTHWAKGATQLLAGDFPQGWVNYNWRWRDPNFGNGAPRDFGTPRYTGAEDLAGRTLFVHAEQGFGETIQFCRYVPIIAGMGAKVLFMVQPELTGFLKASGLPCTFFAPGDRVPRFDYDLPLLNSPAALGTTVAAVPARVPYLTPPAEKAARWQSLLGPRKRPRIGIAWSGRRSHVDDHARSIPVEMLAPLFDADAELHVLQTDISETERGFLTDRARIFDLGDRDFGDAAAHVAAMDHIVTVDTSLAHLAGALAKPVSVLLAYSPDFRWMLERHDSPWYPTANLFRQKSPGAWADVVAEAFLSVTAIVRDARE